MYRREPAALILAVAGLLNAVIVIAGARLGLSELEVGGLTSAVLAMAAALVRSQVTPAVGGGDEDPPA